MAEGPVGMQALGRWPIFRYEIRRWKDGALPDVRFAVDSPVLVASDPNVVDAVLELAPRVPTPTWGRDELGLGEMWNSNSVVSWLLAGAGAAVVDAAGPPPLGGRAPGWSAGIRLTTSPGLVG